MNQRRKNKMGLKKMKGKDSADFVGHWWHLLSSFVATILVFSTCLTAGHSFAQGLSQSESIFDGIPWGSSFSDVKKKFPAADTLDTSEADYCKGSYRDICRRYQVILDDHVVGNLHFKVIFLFSIKAKLNGVNFYLLQPENESIKSLKIRYLQTVDLISQKYGNPLAMQDFHFEELAGGWTGLGQATWHTPTTLIQVDAKMSRAATPEIPPHEKNAAYFMILYRPISGAIRGV